VLEKIYAEAFKSNPYPENIIIDENEDEGEDMSPAAAFADSNKIVLSIFEDKALVGGAVITQAPNINILDRLFIIPALQGNGLGYAAWLDIERDYSLGHGWILRFPTYLIKNACFYVNKCGFCISKIEDIGKDGIGMFVCSKE